MNSILEIDLIILFFFLGAIASWIKSDLEIPEPISKFLSIFLLLALGLKGGYQVRSSDELTGFGPIFVIGLATCFLIPTYMYHLLKKRISMSNAAALAACYGSVSAVTFITAQGYLQDSKIESSGFMVAIMALMEIPAIVTALYYYRRDKNENSISTTKTLLNIFATKSVVLLIGGFLIGLMMNESSWKEISPVVQHAFKGVLVFFLLDLGVLAQRRFHEAWEFKKLAGLVSLILPLIHGTAALLLAELAEVQTGNQILIAVLAGSASYIAAPAAIKMAAPDANTSLYVSLPLAMTFPMNVAVGIPYYMWLASLLN